VAHCPLDFCQNRGTQQQLDQLGVELRSLPFGDRAPRVAETARMAVAAAVRDRVEAVGDRDDAGL
jgi:hypothetical protein